MTGAFFQDTEQSSMRATTGEVDVRVDGNTPLSQSFGPLMPGEQGDTNTYSLGNVGTGPVDYYLASANWNAESLAAEGGSGNAGTTFTDGVVTLDSTGQPAGTSYEWADLDVPVANGDTISFQYKMDDVGCGGGVPRVFIQGGAYNTWDDSLDCGSAPDADGWRTISQPINGIVDGTAGHTGIVNDNTSDPGTMLVRNVTISGASVTGSPFNMCDPAHDYIEVRVNSSTHDTGFKNLCLLPASPILVAEDVQPQTSRSVDVTLRLNGDAQNNWANKVGTADLIVIATQANQAPTGQADQATNDA
jgi:hypothetical protein